MGEWKLMNLHNVSPCQQTSVRSQKASTNWYKKVFPNIAQIYKNHQWLSTRAILAAKNIDVNTINFTIQHGIPSETTTYKSINTVENQDEVLNYPTEFLNSLDFARHATARSYIEIWRTHHTSSKHKSTTTLQRNQTLSQENDEQCYRGNNFDWKILR
ncbi:ATP-dependent DNA helicase [Trichonephila clavipes]|nr:ATP-dependent DNA helicase [Trichonephila clavipes]